MILGVYNGNWMKKYDCQKKSVEVKSVKKCQKRQKRLSSWIHINWYSDIIPNSYILIFLEST